MGIKTKHRIKRISAQEFHEIDYQITGFAFDIHNEIGRLWDEKIYRNELANRCRKAGLGNVEIEVPVIVSYRDFVKEYAVDMLVDDSIVYELKTVNKLSSEHERQTLHYLFLFGLQHGKLINFRPTSVEKRFVSTSMLPKDRHDVVFDDKQWLDLDEESGWLKGLIVELIMDWGAFLETSLFYEAIYHFRGGEDQVVKDIEVILNETNLGNQKVHLLNPNVAFKITAITKGTESYEQQLNRFIRLTKLNAIHWINFNHHVISFKTMLNQKR
ncbi:MAG: GxxExxY protein [candidate division KSB1 bacterium]|nr:GxxExxY protein [candidate division KSB1 bacterium]MDZ7311325.1 GxxExxY protein [candidate division KSB1 bacterium]